MRTFYMTRILDLGSGIDGWIEIGPYTTRKEATWAGEHEIAAAAEIFGPHHGCTFTVRKHERAAA